MESNVDDSVEKADIIDANSIEVLMGSLIEDLLDVTIPPSSEESEDAHGDGDAENEAMYVEFWNRASEIGRLLYSVASPLLIMNALQEMESNLVAGTSLSMIYTDFLMDVLHIASSQTVYTSVGQVNEGIFASILVCDVMPDGSVHSWETRDMQSLASHIESYLTSQSDTPALKRNLAKIRKFRDEKNLNLQPTHVDASAVYRRLDTALFVNIPDIRYNPDMVDVSIQQGHSIASRLEHAMQRTHPKSTVSMFGSRATGLSHSLSDIDMVTMLPMTPEMEQANSNLITERGFLSQAVRELESIGKPRDVLYDTVRLLEGMLAGYLKHDENKKTSLKKKNKQGKKGLVYKCGMNVVQKLKQDIIDIGSTTVPKSHAVYRLLPGIADEFQVKDVKSIIKETISDLDELASSRSKEHAKILLGLKKALYASGFHIENVIRHAKVPLLKTIHKQFNVHCDITTSNSFCLYNTRFLREMLSYDKTNKIFEFVKLVKIFAKKHNISDASSGTVSSYCWVIMAVAFLIKHKYLPVVEFPEGELVDGLCFQYHITSMPCADMTTVSLFQLFEQFIEYYACDFDMLSDAVSLRHPDMIMKKSNWRKYIVWRLSVEDPFEHAESNVPHDLGASMSTTGMTKVLWTLRTALNAIVALKQHFLSEHSDDAAILELFDGDQFVRFSDTSPLKKKKQSSAAVETKMREQKIKHEIDNNETKMSTSMLRDGVQKSVSHTQGRNKDRSDSHNGNNNSDSAKQHTRHPAKQSEPHNHSSNSNSAMQHKRHTPQLNRNTSDSSKKEQRAPDSSEQSSTSSHPHKREPKPKHAVGPDPQLNRNTSDSSKSASHLKRNKKQQDHTHPSPASTNAAPDMKFAEDTMRTNVKLQHQTHKKKGDHKRHHEETQEKRSTKVPKSIGRVVVVAENTV